MTWLQITPALVVNSSNHSESHKLQIQKLISKIIPFLSQIEIVPVRIDSDRLLYEFTDSFGDDNFDYHEQYVNNNRTFAETPIRDVTRCYCATR